MKTIKAQEDVKVKIANEDPTKETESTCSLNKFIRMAVFSFPEFGKGLKNIRAGNRIINASDKKVIELEDADYEMLCKALESMELNPAGAQKLLPFYEAIIGAK